jgi:predicted deacylase
MDIIEVGSAKADGPGRFEGMLKVGAYPDGAPIEIPVIIIRGKEPGPVLWMHACVHGDEYCGTYNIHAFLAHSIRVRCMGLSSPCRSSTLRPSAPTAA